MIRALAALALAAAPRAADLRSQDGVELALERRDDATLVTLRAEGASLERVIGRLAGELGLEVEGLSAAPRATLVSADLELRPLDHVLEVVLGSVGLSYRLRTDTLTISADPAESGDAHGLLQLAGAAYLRAVQRWPRHAQAPAARLAQGEIADLSGYPGAALEHYQTLIATYPKALEVPEAYLRSGLVLERLGRWSDAAVTFRTLANLELPGEHAVVARIELARATVEIGDPQSALYLLAALDTGYPPKTAADRARRELVRALALVGVERHLEGLRAIESVEPLLTGAEKLEGLRVRALALQGAGYPAEAGRAWLLFAQSAGEPARGAALEQAARLALEAGDEVGALFVVRAAEEHGHGPRFARYRDEAYRRLGFATADSGEGVSASDRVASADAALQRGDAAAAASLVRDLIPGSGALEPDLRVRLAATWSRCVAATQGLEPALAHLRATRAALAGPEHQERRARLDVAAAELCFDARLFDRAADAYRGVY